MSKFFKALEPALRSRGHGSRSGSGRGLRRHHGRRGRSGSRSGSGGRRRSGGRSRS